MARKAVLVCCCWLVLSCAAVVRAERWIVPAAAHVTGALDTNWRTDLRLVNPTDSEVSVRVYLLETGQDNSRLDVSKVYVVPAQGQVLLADILTGSFAFDGTGALLIESEEGRLVATTRTYNLVSDGSTYGQFIPAVALDDALVVGEEGQIVHLAKSPDFRSNLGLAATTADAGRVAVELYDAEGVLRGSTERDFSGFEHFQFNDIFGATGAPPAAVARAVIRTTTPIVVYGSVVDQGTGDPVAIMFQRLTDAATELAITAAARAPGAQGSVWRTDLRIYNPGETAATVVITYHQKGMAGGPRPSETLTVDAGRILAVDDFMLNGLGLTAANGGLRISSDRPILVWSRTFNQADTGTFGQSIPAAVVPSTAKAVASHTLTGLGNAGFRSNVGFFNIGDVSDTPELKLRDGTGNIVGEGGYQVASGVMDQINDIFSFFGAGGEMGQSYWLTVDAGEGVIPYLSVSDNLSNDPVYDPGTVKGSPCELGLPVTADAFIQGGDFSDTRYGHYSTLLIKGVAGGTYARKSYMVFDLSMLPPLPTGGRVMLMLTASRHVSTIPRDAVVSGIIDNNDWNPGVLAENLITWNNAPRNDLVSGVAFLDQGATSNAGVRQLATVTFDNTDPPDTAYLIDVTDFVTWAVGGDPSFSNHAAQDDDGLVTLLIAHSEEISGVDGTEFYSRENTAGLGCFQPQLVVEP